LKFSEVCVGRSQLGRRSSVFTFLTLMSFYRIHRLRRFQRRLFSPPESFIPDVYGTKTRRRKPAPKNIVALWLRFLEHVCWVLQHAECEKETQSRKQKTCNDWQTTWLAEIDLPSIVLEVLGLLIIRLCPFPPFLEFAKIYSPNFITSIFSGFVVLVQVEQQQLVQLGLYSRPIRASWHVQMLLVFCITNSFVTSLLTHSHARHVIKVAWNIRHKLWNV